VNYAATQDTSTWGSMGKAPGHGIGSDLARLVVALAGAGAVAAFSGGSAVITAAGAVALILEALSSDGQNTTPGAALGVSPPMAIMNGRAHRRELFEGLMAAADTAFELAAEDEADPPSASVWAYARVALERLGESVSTPMFTPLQLGGISAEWHEHGMNIELRFRGVQEVFVVIEDAKGELPDFHGPDPKLTAAASALRHLADRAT
jgi:hypothetical protein